MPGLPVSRGPIESKSAWASRWTCELSMPSRQILWRFGSLLGNVGPCCPAIGVANRIANDPTMERLRVSDIVAEESLRRVNGIQSVDHWMYADAKRCAGMYELTIGS